jgi:GT2 family glycosyltransferase
LYNAANRGFAAACNQAAHGASGRYLLFLNSDVTVAARSIETLVAALERDAGLAGVAPLEHDAGGRVTSPARRWLDPVVQGVALLGCTRARGPIPGGPVGVESVRGVTAAALLVRGRAFRLVGGFDEGFFFYEEDEDLGWRLARRGYRVAVCADALVLHSGGLSAGAAGAWPGLALYAGQARFLARRYGAPGAWVYRISTSIAVAVKGAAGVLLRHRRIAGTLARPAPFRVLKLLWSGRTRAPIAEG